MTFNNLTDLPGLFLLMLLGGLYMMRKEFSSFYRPLSFFFVYWVQYIILLKFLKDMLTEVRYIRIWLENHPESTPAYLNDILFGGLKKVNKSLKHANHTYGGLCLFSCYVWRIVKWFEVREKNEIVG